MSSWTFYFVSLVLYFCLNSLSRFLTCLTISLIKLSHIIVTLSLVSSSCHKIICSALILYISLQEQIKLSFNNNWYEINENIESFYFYLFMLIDKSAPIAWITFQYENKNYFKHYKYSFTLILCIIFIKNTMANNNYWSLLESMEKNEFYRFYWQLTIFNKQNFAILAIKSIAIYITKCIAFLELLIKAS